MALQPAGSWMGGLEPDQIRLIGLALQPAERVYATGTVETFTGGEDERVQLTSIAGGSLFFATDDTATPTDVWLGTDPAAPVELHAVQAEVDADWQGALQDDPNLPRWVVAWQFHAGTPGDQLRIVGWDGNGHLLVEGRAWIAQSCIENATIDGLIGAFGWWG
ncbi:MAG: hypothetical protein ACK4MX_11805, partial [Thermaurantiacus sp.]